MLKSCLKSAAICVVALAPTSLADSGGAEAQRCKALVQNKVAWDAFDPRATRWEDANLDRLCGTGRPAEDVIACFEARLDVLNDWDAAISACTGQAASQAPLPEAVDGAKPQETAPGNRPSARAEWVDGQWQEIDGYWKWVEGHWEEPEAAAAAVPPEKTPGNPPSATAVWVDGHWQQIDGYWKWVEGRWEEPGAGPDSAAPDNALTAACKAAVQGQVSWDPSDPSATDWTDEDLSRLCQSTAVVKDTVACFTEILAETKSREQALGMCSRLHPSGG